MDRQTVEKVARLARLRMEESELDVRAAQLSKIIGFIEQLNEVKTDHVEPLPSPVDTPLPLRRDAVTDGGRQVDVLANAPESLSGYYVVPKVVE